MPDLAETADVVVVGGSTAGAVPAVRPPGSGVTRWRPLHGSTPRAFPGLAQAGYRLSIASYSAVALGAAAWSQSKSSR